VRVAPTSQDDLICYSARLLKPFARLLDPRGGNAGLLVEVDASQPDERSSLDSEGRVPVNTVHDWLTAAIEKTRDPYLGLKAGALMTAGDAGVLDYLVQTAPTVERALDVATRYLRLVNEAMSCRLELDGSRVFWRLDPYVPLPAAAEDFLLSSWLSAHAWLREIPDLEVFLSHGPPPELEPYRHTFGAIRCRFSAGCSGWSFSHMHMDRPLEGADPNLHAILRRVADRMLTELPTGTASLSERVRALIALELAMPGLSTAWVARRLRMSVRTLTRRLEAESTSFYSLLDEARRARAVSLMNERRLAVSEIAFRLGFAHAPSFHRAFRRWTGQTPSEYRRTLPSLELSS
jgi:AraC-like DNA-binding protein